MKKQTFDRIKRILAILLVVLFVATMTAGAVSANVDMTKYNGKTLNLNANGYQFHTSALTFLGQQDGSYTFNSVISSNPPETISGSVVGRHITFKIDITDGSVQSYDGWIFDQAPNTMAGTFSHLGVDQYAWYGYLS